jgi:hypothetical protein
MFESNPSPPAQPKANTGAPIPVLIEGVVPIPPVLSLRSKAVLERLYKREHVSAREISRLAGASRSGVLNALDRFSIPRDNARPARTGHLLFGFEYVNHQLVKNEAEQAAIRRMRQYRTVGLSLREIAGNLNLKLISTKQSIVHNEALISKRTERFRYWFSLIVTAEHESSAWTNENSSLNRYALFGRVVHHVRTKTQGVEIPGVSVFGICCGLGTMTLFAPCATRHSADRCTT